MVQQTIVRDLLVEIYSEFLIKYPSISALANAREIDLRKIIQPLGLHYRANEMIRMAEELIERHNGKIPNDISKLISIFGIGDYSARAVLCFAYGENVPTVDVNVARILYRVFGIPGNIPENPARKKGLMEIQSKLIPKGRAKEFNWAMMDLAALICKKANPTCIKCPLHDICTYGNRNGAHHD